MWSLLEEAAEAGLGSFCWGVASYESNEALLERGDGSGMLCFCDDSPSGGFGDTVDATLDDGSRMGMKAMPKGS